jgi:DNA-binding CsgD family transcriptional regulator
LSADGRIRIALRIGEVGLSARLAAVLAKLPEIELVESDANVEIVAAAPRFDGQLSPREQDVLALLAEGASNREIAARLGISVHTAKFHVRRIADKLDAVGRTDAVAMALQRRMIDV